MQIASDVYLIKGRASNLYLCIDDHGLALIDAGMPRDQTGVLAEIERLGYGPENLTRILITHADIDHAGALAALQEVSGATVYAGRESAVLLQQGKSPEHLPQPIQWLSNIFAKYKPLPGSCLEIIQDGDLLPALGGLQSLSTPGHTPEHFSFYCQGNGVLFAGDALSTRGNRLQSSPRAITADRSAANRSAMRLLELAPAVFACGHGHPMSGHRSEDLVALYNQLRVNGPDS